MEMESTTRLFWISVVVLVFCVCSLPRSAAETEACRKVYREGGAMAVIRSPECPRWGHSLSWGRLTDSTTVYCSEAILDALGRDFTHNHFFCDVDIRFPLRRLQKEATLGIVAIFDGYYSNEASETAWKYIEEYFFLHTYFLFDRLEGDNFDGSSHVKMLKEALVRAIHDLKNRYTATIIVMVDDHLFLSSLDGSAEVATGSYSRWMAASQSQSVCEVSSRRLDGDGWGDSLKNLIYNISANTISHLIMQAVGHVSLAQKVSQKDVKDDIGGLQQAPRYGLSQCQCKLATSDGDENMCKIGMGLLDSVPALNVCSTSFADFRYKIPASRYVLKRRLGQGGFGETWLASYLNCSKGENAVVSMHEDQEVISNSFCLDPWTLLSDYSSSTNDCHSSSSYGDSFIIKRVMVERGSAVYLSGLREKYFGEVFLNASLHDGERVEHVARYVQSLDCGVKGMWLVFLPEGVSLWKLLYTMEAVKATVEESKVVNNAKVLQRSSYWYWLKTTEQGRVEMRSIIRQLLMALKFCHDRSIIHRDIKPGNMVICVEDETNGRCLEQRPSEDTHFHTKMRIIDFGSAVDEFTRKHLYGLYGPSSSEQTYYYTPPEALLNASWFQGSTSTTLKYDLWSVGVVALEMIVGTPYVFQLSHRSYAVLILQSGSLHEDEMNLLFRFRAFAALCNKMPGDSEHLRSWREKIADGTLLASTNCSKEFLSSQIRNLDPLQLGFPNDLALQLVHKLLTWAPEDRLSVYDALQHPYFQSLH